MHKKTHTSGYNLLKTSKEVLDKIIHIVLPNHNYHPEDYARLKGENHIIIIMKVMA